MTGSVEKRARLSMDSDLASAVSSSRNCGVQPTLDRTARESLSG
jgi:hypothetical protein